MKNIYNHFLLPLSLSLIIFSCNNKENSETIQKTIPLPEGVLYKLKDNLLHNLPYKVQFYQFRIVQLLQSYKKSFRKSFDQFYGNISEYCILSLLTNYREREGSSLIYMVDDFIKNSQHPKSGFYLNNYKGLSSTLQELEEIGQKTILIGVSYALLDLADQFPQNLEQTIIMETGGTKGERKELIKEELHKILKNAFSLNKNKWNRY